MKEPPVERRIGNTHIVPFLKFSLLAPKYIDIWSNAERVQQRGRGHLLDIPSSGLVGYTSCPVFVYAEFIDQCIYSIFDDVAPLLPLSMKDFLLKIPYSQVPLLLRYLRMKSKQEMSSIQR